MVARRNWSPAGRSMSSPDDLDVGQHIFITKNSGDNGQTPFCFHYSGDPLLIEAIAFPFLAVRTPSGRVMSIDIRSNVVNIIRDESYICVMSEDTTEEDKQLDAATFMEFLKNYSRQEEEETEGGD